VKIGYAASTLALGLVLAAAPASALDTLTGSYEGKMTCKGIEAGSPVKEKQEIVIEVVDTKGVALRLLSNGVQVGEVMTGRLAEDSAKADRGKLGGLSCSVDAFERLGSALVADAVVKPMSEKGSLKGSLTTLGENGVVECTFTAKRTSTATPEFSFCLFEL
jgi:hypothetical protein